MALKKHYKKSEINLNKKKKKPSFGASISDFALTLIHEEKLMLVAIFSAIFFFSLIILESLQISQNLKKQADVKQQKDRIVYEISFWQQVVSAHPQYRDAYFMIALLQYRLGDIVSSKGYLQKAMSIDPNFEKGKELEKILQKNSN
jgi:hypothetical protein